MIEFYVWFATLALAGFAHLYLAKKYSVNIHKLAIPRQNAEFMRRLAITDGITYLSFMAFGIFACFAFPAEIAIAVAVAKSWWIVEIFIAWNIRTAFLIFMNVGRLKIVL